MNRIFSVKCFAAVVALGSCSISAANASSIILDGTFQDSIGTGTNVKPWADFTDAGVATHSAPSGVSGNFAALPVNTDLIQWFNPLPDGTYELSFLVRNEGRSPAALVFAVQERGGTPINVLFDQGTAEQIIMPVSNLFQRVTFDFTLSNMSFIPNEFYFSNSFDDPIPPIEDSINPPGTIIDVADVSLVALSAPVPEPRTWALLLVGLCFVGLLSHRRKRKWNTNT